MSASESRYVSENQHLPEWMTPNQLLDYCRPLYPAWDDALRQELQGKLGLTANAPLRTLSRGTRMKATLLSSLAYRPELIVLDEPFTGLDPVARDELVGALLEAGDDQPRTVLISSHDIEESNASPIGWGSSTVAGFSLPNRWHRCSRAFDWSR